MVIRKEFKVESAHIVRNCSSERCSHSIHGHSARIEVFFEASQLDNAQMVVDFGLFKNEIKAFIDSMDHCYLLCNREPDSFRSFIKRECDRWIEMPFNPSAEMLSLFVYDGISKILRCTHFNNGESPDVKIKAVRYHETATGYAECTEDDYKHIWLRVVGPTPVTFSNGIQKDWRGTVLKDALFDVGAVIENPVIKQQINLK